MNFGKIFKGDEVKYGYLQFQQKLFFLCQLKSQFKRLVLCAKLIAKSRFNFNGKVWLVCEFLKCVEIFVFIQQQNEMN